MGVGGLLLNKIEVHFLGSKVAASKARREAACSCSQQG